MCRWAKVFLESGSFKFSRGEESRNTLSSRQFDRLEIVSPVTIHYRAHFLFHFWFPPSCKRTTRRRMSRQLPDNVNRSVSFRINKKILLLSLSFSLVFSDLFVSPPPAPTLSIYTRKKPEPRSLSKSVHLQKPILVTNFRQPPGREGERRKKKKGKVWNSNCNFRASYSNAQSRRKRQRERERKRERSPGEKNFRSIFRAESESVALRGVRRGRRRIDSRSVNEKPETIRS